MKRELRYLLVLSLSLLASHGAQAQRWYTTTDEIGRAIDNNIQNARDSIFLLDYENEASRYICSYVSAYFEPPKDISSLISGFDYSESGEFMRSVYPTTFRLLEKYRDDLLIYADDSVTAIFYKTIDPQSLVAASVCVKPENDNLGKFNTGYNFYNREGYYAYTEEKEELYQQEHNAIMRRYDCWVEAVQTTLNYFRYEMVFLEYTPNQGLVNLEAKKPIDVGASSYFKEVEQWMKETCERNGYSRMIIPSRVPLGYS